MAKENNTKNNQPFEIAKTTIEYKKIGDIRPYEKNPRKNDGAVKYVVQSIKDFGFKVPIVIDKDGVIICGHTRYKAAIRLKLKEVPCITASDLTDEQIKAFRIADNKVSEYAEWDLDLLNEELADIININMDDYGFENVLEEKEEIEDDGFDLDEALQEPPRTKSGEKYRLGDHILMIGDSTSEHDVAELMSGEQADLVVTDPPYNVNVKNSQGMTIANDNLENDEFHQFLKSCFKNMRDHLKAGGAFYVWYAASEHINFETSLNENGFRVRQQLIWNKNSANFSRADYHWKHENCLYGWKDGAAHYFVEDYTQKTVYEEEIPNINKLKKEELVELVKKLLDDTKPTTVINEDKPHCNDLHPTMKPLKLIGKLVKNSSKMGETVLDLFGGSGSTLIVCEQLGRTCRMMEYEPKYADAIIKRWEDYTGQTAELIED